MAAASGTLTQPFYSGASIEPMLPAHATPADQAWAIVKEIVEAHDGSITAYNAPSGGAVFLMAFPSMT